MKIYDSGMPEENYWNTIFDIEENVNWLQLETVEAPNAESGLFLISTRNIKKHWIY